MYEVIALCAVVIIAMAGAAKYAKNPSGYCFVAGTLVLTLAGLIAIENVRPGDIVYAKEAVGIEQSVDIQEEAALNPVLEVYEREVYETYKLTISPSDNSLEAEVIETTAYHPFYTEYGEAIEAKDLKEGDKLLTSEGDTATVEKTEKITYDEPIIVYNFAVLDTHTYYVGDVGVLVHNKCGGKFSEVKASVNIGEVGHHMPQNAYTEKVLNIARDDGPSLKMSKVDHALTRTFAGKGRATMILDEGLNARQRLAKDIYDVKKQFGRKYNNGLIEVVKYARTLPQFEKE